MRPERGRRGEERARHDRLAALQRRLPAFLELGGEWEGRQKIGGETERESGSKWLYVAPGARFNLAANWSAGAAIALPVWQDIRASHPDNRYRLMLSLGRSF